MQLLDHLSANAQSVRPLTFDDIQAVLQGAGMVQAATPMGGWTIERA